MSEGHVSRRRPSHRKDRRQLNQSQSFTPPAYLVRENSRQELVGASYEVVWPQFTPEGRFSRDACLSDATGSTQSAERSASCSQLTTANSTDFQDSVWDRTVPALCADNVSKHFAGVVTQAQLKRKLTPTHFVLFYERQERMHSIVDIPTQLPLKLGYMSAIGTVHSFDVSRKPCPDGSEKWQVQLGRESSKQPMFNQLSKLVSYYATFVLFTASACDQNDVDCFSVRSRSRDSVST